MNAALNPLLATKPPANHHAGQAGAAAEGEPDADFGQALRQARKAQSRRGSDAPAETRPADAAADAQRSRQRRLHAKPVTAADTEDPKAGQDQTAPHAVDAAFAAQHPGDPPAPADGPAGSNGVVVPDAAIVATPGPTGPAPGAALSAPAAIASVPAVRLESAASRIASAAAQPQATPAPQTPAAAAGTARPAHRSEAAAAFDASAGPAATATEITSPAGSWGARNDITHPAGPMTPAATLATSAAAAAPTASMEPAAAAPAPAADASLPPPPGSEAFAPALGAAITRFVRDGIEHARLQLNPAELGPVAVQLALDGSQVRVEMAAEVAATRDALQAALPALAGALREAGFTLGGGGVFQQPPQPSRDASGERLPGPAERRDAEAPIKAVAAQRQGLVDLYA